MRVSGNIKPYAILKGWAEWFAWFRTSQQRRSNNRVGNDDGKDAHRPKRNVGNETNELWLKLETQDCI